MNIRRLTLLPNLYWATMEPQAHRDLLSAERTRAVLGQFSLLLEDEENYHLVRDRLGLNKLFYHVDSASNTLTVGHYLFDVARATHDCNGVLSVPAGHQLVIHRRTLERRLVCYWDLSRVTPRAGVHFSPERFQRVVDEHLARAFTELRCARPGSRFFVCLSGGLDSTVVAAYARRYLGNVTAVSFSYERLSDDFRAAEAIAARLGLPFLPVVIQRRFDPNVLDEVLRHGQDWRDFNVHCAWVNRHIARGIGEVARPARGAGATARNGSTDSPAWRRPAETVVLTGDLMNELVADYTPVKFGGAVHYPRPRLPRDKLRRFFVYGLDAGDRELGIFYRHGLTAVQPYSLVAEAYLSVPGDFLAEDGCKERLNRALLSRVDAAGVADCLLKGKIRAQVGSAEDGGTLGLFHEAGITQRILEERWRALFAPLTREGELRPVIVGGRYRFEDSAAANSESRGSRGDTRLLDVRGCDKARAFEKSGPPQPAVLHFGGAQAGCRGFAETGTRQELTP